MKTNIKTLPLQTLHINKTLTFIKLNSSYEENLLNTEAFLTYIDHKKDSQMSFLLCAEKGVNGIKISYNSGDKSIDSINKALLKTQIKNYNAFSSKRNQILKKLEVLNKKIC